MVNAIYRTFLKSLKGDAQSDKIYLKTTLLLDKAK
jgi:hypothetical protein